METQGGGGSWCEPKATNENVRGDSVLYGVVLTMYTYRYAYMHTHIHTYITHDFMKSRKEVLQLCKQRASEIARLAELMIGSSQVASSHTQQ